MQGMTIGQLRERYAELHGEPTRSRHKMHLIRKIAWRMQALAEGDLSERARRRAEELANDADIRVMPPKSQRVNVPAGDTAMSTDVAGDSRIPAVGQAINRKYKGRTIRVVVRSDGFEYDGERYRSLSAVAKAVTGSHCNGFRFFGLEAK
jgi:hypothetical protein